MKVVHMKNQNGGNAPSQFIITHGDIKIFQSYGQTIAKLEDGELTLDWDWDTWKHNATTMVYLNKFSGMSTKELEKGVEEESIRLINLNDE